MPDQPARVRFAPSPTGYLHIGGARTALFNWLLARKTDGSFVLRIEDTDRSRHVADSMTKIFDDLHWLGLDWDEGPKTGGDYGPYLQSERLDIYKSYCDKLLEAGQAYYALETPEELAAARENARREKRSYAYCRPDPLPTAADAAKARAEGRPVSVRFMMPARELVVVDEILGDVRLAGEELEDFVVLKGDGWPTYHFACVVDDALMKINFVLRGQEHLINTPKHVALQQALGFETPRYAHLPIIFNMDGTKMSKRTAVKDFANKLKSARQRWSNLDDEEFVGGIAGRTDVSRDIVREIVAGRREVVDDALRAVAGDLGIDLLEVNVHDFRTSGYLPETVINFISLLGWSAGEDREQMTLQETVELFDVSRIGKTNARFDRTKLVAFNTDWCNRVSTDRLEAALDDYLGLTQSPFSKADDGTRRHLLEVCAGFRTFKELDDKCQALFAPDEQIAYDPKAVKKVLARHESQGFEMLKLARAELEQCEPWDQQTLEALIERICRQHDTKLGNVAQPLRVAVTGTTISPPIFDTLVILGKDRTLARVDRCLANRPTESE